MCSNRGVLGMRCPQKGAIEEGGAARLWRVEGGVLTEGGLLGRVCSESRARPGVVCSGIMGTGLLRVLHHPCQSLSSRMGGSNLLSLAHTNRPEAMQSHSTPSCPDSPQRSLTSVHTYMRYVQYIQWLLGGLQEHSETLTCAVIYSAATAMYCTCRPHCLRSWFWVTVQYCNTIA